MCRVVFAAAFVVCVGMSSAVLATDLSLKDTPNYEYAPAPIWTDLYFGVHVGGRAATPTPSITMAILMPTTMLIRRA